MAGPDTKRCPTCAEVKLVSEFSRRADRRDGLAAQCRRCVSFKERRRKYGVTQEDWDHMFAQQGGLCAACRVEPCEVVDHCHTTSVVRGLLCHGCNSAMGWVKDDPDRLVGCAMYLLAQQDVLSGLA